MSDALRQINALIEKEAPLLERLIAEAGKVIVGQRHVLDGLVIGLLTGGHLLLEGVPGLAKTLAIQTLATTVQANFKRVQFTADLLPSDVIGTLIYDPSKQVFTPKLGPVFTHFLLADEINRAPAKVQSALLEAMQEKQVTLGDKTYALPQPFLVLATQNPIDQEGTYILPEAQMDRFLMKIKVGYPSKVEEKKIIERMTAPTQPTVDKIMKLEDVERLQKVIPHIYVDEKIKNYVLDIVFATREPEKVGLADLKRFIAYPASPRASLSLIQAAKAHAFLRRRGYVTPEDIKAVGKDVLRHRVIASFEAEAEGMSSDTLIDRVFSEIDVP